MKFLKGSALLISMGLLFGTASAVGGTIEVKAADETIPEGFRLEYLRISDELYEDWTSRGAGLYVNWWGSEITAPDGSNNYAVGEEIGDTDIHPLYVPADSTGFLIYNGNWGSKNQTVDVSLSKLDDAYDRVAALDSLGTTMYYDSAIVYEVTGNTIKTDDQERYDVSLNYRKLENVSSDYARYWFDRGPREFGYYWFLGFNIGTASDPEWKAIQATDYPLISGEGDTAMHLAYFDVPTSFIGRDYFAFSLTSSYYETTENEDNTTNTVTLKASDFSKVHGISWPNPGEGWSGPWWPVILDDDNTYVSLEANSVMPEFIANYVLPAYYTCLPSEANGYLAASELIDTWMSNDRLIGGMDALADVTLQDYAYAGPDANYDDYYTTADRTSTTTALDKLNTMEILEASHAGDNAGYVGTFVSDPPNIATITAGALVLVSILGFSVFYFVRRRKHASN